MEDFYEAKQELSRAIRNKDHNVSMKTLQFAYEAMCDIDRIRCNGYKNHATHELALIIDGTEELYVLWNTLAIKHSTNELADLLKEWVQYIYIPKLDEYRNTEMEKYKVMSCLCTCSALSIDYGDIARRLKDNS